MRYRNPPPQVHWDFTGMIGHPFHMHVVPFQIQALPLDALQPGMRYSNYFEVGGMLALCCALRTVCHAVLCAAP